MTKDEKNKDIERLFNSLPIQVQEALILLKKAKDKAILGISGRGYSSCPIATAYNISGIHSFYYDMSAYNRRILEDNGWDGFIFGAFESWWCYGLYSSGWTNEQKDKFLHGYLSLYNLWV